MKIFTTIENFDDAAIKLFENEGCEVVYCSKLPTDAEVLVIGLGFAVTKEYINSAPYLKLIGTATTGVDHIDTAYAQKKDVEIVRLEPHDVHRITSTAELAFGLLLSLVRHIPDSFDDVKKGNWDREKFLGNNLSGKTLGIVGLGRLGSMMAQYGKAFGMYVIAYDPHKKDDPLYADFYGLLSKSDVVSIHVPLNDDTRNMFAAEEFSKMKPSAVMINTARGAVVNEDDLIRALEEKTIAGYAADVLSGEVALGKDISPHKLVQYARSNPNVVITPHIGGFTKESRAATDVIIAHKVVEAMKA